MFSHELARVAATVSLLMVLVNVRAAEATCAVDNQGPCYRYWHTEMVFLGEVRERELIGRQLIDQQYVLGYNFRLRLSVLERFRGVAQADTEVVVNAYDGECGFAPAVGARVFVYANRGKEGAFWLSVYSSPPPGKPLRVPRQRVSVTVEWVRAGETATPPDGSGSPPSAVVRPATEAAGPSTAARRSR